MLFLQTGVLLEGFLDLFEKRVPLEAAHELLDSARVSFLLLSQVLSVLGLREVANGESLLDVLVLGRTAA